MLGIPKRRTGPWRTARSVGPIIRSTGLGCRRNCYAEADNKRYGWVPGWGPGIPCYRTFKGYWEGPLKWNRKAVVTGCRPRIFCASEADVFDNQVPQEWRTDLWALLRATPNLRWMLLTKRIGNVPRMLPADWPYPHVRLMATLENQEVWDRVFPRLMRLPAPWRGVSAEPLLGFIDIGSARPDGSSPAAKAVRRCAINVNATASHFTTSKTAALGGRSSDAWPTGSSIRAFRRHWNEPARRSEEGLSQRSRRLHSRQPSCRRASWWRPGSDLERIRDKVRGTSSSMK
jgi:Protein of unknown function (DUF5131)